jgi:phage terminase Nu1 subunit (DNA packaging protein)
VTKFGGFAMAEDQKAGGASIISTAAMCQLLMVSRTRIDQLVNDGIIFRHGRGEFRLVETIQAYIRWMRDDARQHNKSAAASRATDARAKEIEIRTAQRLGRLVPLALYDEMIDSFCGLVRSEFAGLAAACTRDLVLRRIIEREVNARLRRMAEFARAESIRLEALRRSDDAIGADGAGRMGGGQSDVSINGGGARAS